MPGHGACLIWASLLSVFSLSRGIARLGSSPGAPWLVTPAVCLGLYLADLGGVPLQLPDEPREAEIAREMWVDGPIAVPHLNGEPHVIKTPLAYWMAAAVLGLQSEAIPGEAAIRFASALSILTTAALVFVFGRRWFDVRHGLLASLILCASPSVLSRGRRFTSDAPLALCVTLAVGAALTALGERGRARVLRWMLLAGGGLGLGFLAKGIIAPVLVGLAVGGAIVLGRGPRALVAPRALGLAGAMLLLLVPAVALWLALLWDEGGRELVDFYLAYHVRGVSGGSGTPHVNPWYFYLARGPDGFLPWLLFLPLLLLRAAAPERLEDGAVRHPGTRELLAWVLVPLAFLSSMSQKREVYLLPLYAPLALLAARALLEPVPDTWPRVARLCRVAWTVLGLGALAGAVVIPIAGGVVGAWAGEPWSLAGGLGLAAGALGVAALARATPSERQAPLRFPFATVALTGLTMLAVLIYIEPARRGERTLRPAMRVLLEPLRSDPTLQLHGYRLASETGIVDGALAYEVGRTFPELSEPAQLRALLQRDPRARVVALTPDWEEAGRPGRVLVEVQAGRRPLVLIGP